LTGSPRFGQSDVHRAGLHPLLRLHDLVGNAQVARLLAQREEDEELLQMKPDPTLIQRQKKGKDSDGGGSSGVPSNVAKRDEALAALADQLAVAKGIVSQIV
jgi:hypothetical protein